MSTIAEAEKLVFSLSEKDRTELVGKILRSLPLYADDGGLNEALRRNEELNENPDMVMSIEELDLKIRERFGWKS